MMPPAVIDQAANLLAETSEAVMATVCEPIHEAREVFDPNVVKVVMDSRGHALYFSRAPIPWARADFERGPPTTLPAGLPYYRHVGLYAYRVGFLRRYCSIPACELEIAEALEQLRALHHGACVMVAEACAPTGIGVDTPADLERVRALLLAKTSRKA
jgi:3-deoxy-manno-octulosonate cytidylyltransferase (CMP-KDO synthetase)